MSTERMKLADELQHAMVTMQNDDLSQPGTEKRQRHVKRYEVMADAVAALRAPAPAENAELERLRATVKNVRHKKEIVATARNRLAEGVEHWKARALHAEAVLAEQDALRAPEAADAGAVAADLPNEVAAGKQATDLLMRWVEGANERHPAYMETMAFLGLPNSVGWVWATEVKFERNFDAEAERNRELTMECIMQAEARADAAEHALAAMQAASPTAAGIAAPPKRWLIEQHMPGGGICWQCVEHEHQAREIAGKIDGVVSPLYAAPPAASADAVREVLERAAKAVRFCGECDCPRLSQEAIRALSAPVAGADAGMRERLKSDWRRQIETVTGERETAECIVNLAELNGLFDTLAAVQQP